MAALMPEGKQSFNNGAGAPLVGGKLYTYDAGTNTPRPTYQDSAGTVPNTNPIILDSRGEATLFWSGAYKVVLKDSADVIIWVVDNVLSDALRTDLANASDPAKGAGMVGFQQDGTGAVSTTVQSKLREHVSVKDFGAVGDGITDDTAAMINAMKFCRANGKTLLLEGQIVFNASSVPSGEIVSGSYVNACSMVGFNAAELLVNGKIGFLLTGVDRTLVEGFKVTTTGREMTESDLRTSSPDLFATNLGSKSSAVYRDLVVYHNVTSLTGEYRAGATFRERGCSAVEFDNVKVSNSTVVVVISQSSNIVVRNVFGYNVQTNIYLTTVADYQVTNSHLTNTKQQADYWVQRTNASPLSFAGMDNLMVEAGDRGTVIGLHTTWAIERVCYIQSSNVKLSNCYTLNSDGHKLVGTDYNNQVENHYIDSCHVVVGDDWVGTRGRSRSVLLTSYWANNVHISDSSITNTVPDRAVVDWAISFGRFDGSTAEGLYVSNCTAIHVGALVQCFVSGRTAAELAALTPQGTFVSVRNVDIRNCYIKHHSLATNYGSLFNWYSVGASADALAQLAGENIVIEDNKVEMLTSTAVWLFTPRWNKSVITRNNNVNIPFVDSFFSSAVSAPYENIRMNEPYLKFGGVNSGVMIDRLANLTMAADSNVTFTGVLGKQQIKIKAGTYEAAAFLDNRVTVELFGKGYIQVNTTRGYGIEMNANGNFYFGKVISGTKTDQVSTPPIMIDLSTPGVIQYRGDLQSTVDYYTQMTLI